MNLDASYLYCPICGVFIHGYSHHYDLRHPEDIADQADLFSVEHFRRQHRVRWWLWRRTAWRWPVKGFFG